MGAPMHERLRRALRDVVVVVLVCTTPVAVTLVMADGRDEVDHWGASSVNHPIWHSLRHGLAPVVATMARIDEPLEDTTCITVPPSFDVMALGTEQEEEEAALQAERERLALIEHALTSGASGVLLDIQLANYERDEEGASSEGVIDEESPILQVLTTEPRVAAADDVQPLFLLSDEPPTEPIPNPVGRILDVAPWEPSRLQLRPQGAVAPVNSFVVMSNGLFWSSLVARFPDGEVRPTRGLAAWMLAEGATGPITVTPSAVTVGTTSFPADNGWIELSPPGPGWPLPPDEFSPYRCAESVLLRGDDLLESDHNASYRLVDADFDGALVHVVEELDIPSDGRDDAALLTELGMLRTGERARTSSRMLTFLLALFGAAVVAFVGRTESWWAGLTTLGLVAGGAWGLAVGTWDLGPTFDLLPVLLAAIPAYLVSVWLRGRANRQYGRRLEQLVLEYAPREVTGDLLGTRADEPLMTGEREATVVFCDLRQFTPVAAELEPADVQRLLEVFYRHVGERVRATGGTLVQYVGDEVFASFGPPAVVDDHADRALACARALRDDAGEFAAALRAENFPVLHYGVGLHTGRIVTAEVGGDQHRQYSVIGDAVNVGSRLTTAAGPGEVLFSGDLLSRVHDRPDSEQLLEVRLKGVERPLEVYRLS